MKRLIKMKRLLLILLICNLAVVNGHAFTLPDTYLTAPSDTTRYGEDSDEAENDTINRNPKNMERIARQRYFMKHDDEDIFVLSDDVREPQSVASAPMSEEPDDHDAAE